MIRLLLGTIVVAILLGSILVMPLSAYATGVHVVGHKKGLKTLDLIQDLKACIHEVVQKYNKHCILFR